MTRENDIILIYMESAPMAFARVEHITADPKPGWFQVALLILAVPLQTVTWILREEYINGAIFTMEGKSMRLEKVESPAKSHGEEPAAQNGKPKESNSGKDSAEVISFPTSPSQ